MGVFISYSRNDSLFVDRLAKDLKLNGISVWLDKWEIEPGDYIPDTIGKALESCRCFLLILSADSAGSPWVLHEWNTWMMMQLKNEQRAQQLNMMPRRRLLPILIDNSAVPAFLKAVNYIHIEKDGRGYQKDLKKLLNTLQKHTKPPSLLNLTPYSDDDSVGEAKLISHLLRGLIDTQFDKLLSELDLQSLLNSHGSEMYSIEHRAHMVNDIIQLVDQRGPAFIDLLQETILAVRSPFSPFDGKSLTNWIGYPIDCWQVANSQIVGTGMDPMTFPDPDTPEDLKYASILCWEGLSFREGYVATNVIAPAIRQGGAGGLCMCCINNRRAIIALLRCPHQDHHLMLELWSREGRLIRLLKSVSCPPDILARDSCRLAFRVRQDSASASVALAVRPNDELSTCVAPVPLDQKTGYFGYVKFGHGAVIFDELELTVFHRKKNS
jgi:hypothetical protein